ncbi:hypothetical protein HG530_009361 [Fusarium avenaceum]|nr:hypothetical protein HG530_009361 [Fusarium avenaceum]
MLGGLGVEALGLKTLSSFRRKGFKTRLDLGDDLIRECDGGRFLVLDHDIGKGHSATGEEVGDDSAKEEVCVCDSQRTASAVTRRARVSSSAAGTDSEKTIFPGQNRATACSNGVDVELGGLDSYFGQRVLKDMLQRSRVPRHIGTGTAHIKAQHWRPVGIVVASPG